MSDLKDASSEQPVIAELEASPTSPNTEPATNSMKEVAPELSGKHKEPVEANTKRPLDEKQILLDEKPLPHSPADLKAPIGPEFSEKRTLTKSDIATLKAQADSQSANSPTEATGTLPPQYSSPTTTTSLTTSFSQQHLSSPAQQSRSYREFGFYHVAPWRPTHNTIVDPDNCAKYFVEVSEFSKGKPDVTLRDVKSSDPMFAAKADNLSTDEGKQCRAVAFAQFAHGSKDKVRIGLGDHETMSGVKWAEMSKLRDDEWQLVVEVKGKRKMFEWKSAKSSSFSSVDGGGEVSTPSSETPPTEPSSGQMPVMGTFKFVDSSTRLALALYTEAKLVKGWKKRGKMRFYDRRADEEEALSSEDLELLSMMCACVTNEKRRRKTWKKWGTLGMVSSK